MHRTNTPAVSDWSSNVAYAICSNNRELILSIIYKIVGNMASTASTVLRISVQQMDTTYVGASPFTNAAEIESPLAVGS